MWTYTSPRGPIAVMHAQHSDAAAIHRLHKRVLAEQDFFVTSLEEYLGTSETKARYIQDLAQSPNSAMLVARLQGKVAGFLTVSGGVLRRVAHTGKVEIMVGARVRGQGVGRALMAAAVDWATQNPMLTKLGLNVFSDNRAAIALYRSFDFQEEGRRAREYRMEDGRWRDDLLFYRFVD